MGPTNEYNIKGNLNCLAGDLEGDIDGEFDPRPDNLPLKALLMM